MLDWLEYELEVLNINFYLEYKLLIKEVLFN